MTQYQNLKSQIDPINKLRGVFQQSRDQLERAAIKSNIGQIYLKHKNFKEAIKEYQKAIGLNPKQVEAYNGIGLAYTMTQEYDLAISAQKQALELDQNLAEAHAGLGLIYLLTDQQDLALKYYRKAIATRPKFLDPYLKIGRILHDQKHYAEASKIYWSATEVDSTNVEANYNLGLSYDYQDNVTDLALNAYKRVIELDPEYYQAYYRMGLIYEDQNKFEEAEQAYLTIIQHGAKVPQVYNALAQLYGREQGQLNQAVSYAQTAIELSPESANYYNTLALICFRLGDYLQAETAMKKALSLSPENSIYQEGWRQIQQKLDK